MRMPDQIAGAANGGRLRADRLELILGIRAWLLALALAAALPVLLFAGIAAQQLASAERQAKLTELERRTEAMASDVGRYLQSLRELADTLAHTPMLQTGDLAGFYNFAKHAVEIGKIGRVVALADPSGNMLINTRLPFGEAAPPAGDVQGLAETMARKTPHIANLFTGAVTGRHVFTAWAPVFRNGQITLLVGVTVEPQDLITVLREENLPEGWIGVVLDRQGTIVARTLAPDNRVGQQAGPPLLAARAKAARGAIASAVSSEGIPISTYFINVPVSGWTAAIGVPTQLIDAPANASMRFMLGLGLVSLLMAGALAFLVGRRMHQPIDSIVRAAQALGEGRKPTAGPTVVRELRDVADALSAAHALIDAREVALRASEADLKAYFENIAVGTGQIDQDGRFTRVNERFCQITGYSREELLAGMGPLDLGHPDDRAQDRERIDRFFRGELPIYEVEKRYRHKDGHTVWVRVTSSHVWNSDSSGSRSAAVIQDISERKQAEQALRDSNERLHDALKGAHAGAFDVRLGESWVINWSSENRDLYGVSADVPITRDLWASRVHPDDRPALRSNIERAYIDPTWQGWSQEFRILHPERGERWILNKVRMWRDEAGTPVRFDGINVDITERKEAEQILVTAKAELELRVAERTAELQTEMQQREQAQTALSQSQRLDAVGRLASGLAHDFNNALAIIAASLDLAEPHVPNPKASEELRRARDVIELSASLNRRLMAYARRDKPALEQVLINTQIDKAVSFLNRTLGTDVVTINIILDLAPDLWPARLDPSELDSAILNLAINARDAMPAGGTLSLQTRNVTLDANDLPAGSSAMPGDYIRLSVGDTGTGMTEEVLSHAVEPFFTTKNRASNTGLGLSIVHELVKGCGGFLAIESQIGSGTTINLFLPRDMTQTTCKTSAPTNHVPLGNGELVMLVEDNQRLLELTCAVVEGLGYAVITASNGQQALDLLDSGEPVDVVLSDIVMPGGLSGYEVARRVLTDWPGIKVVLATGNSTQPAQDDAVLGNIKVLQKPFARAQLAQAFRAALAS
jgi:PAS domain S-box-containing protein